MTLYTRNLIKELAKHANDNNAYHMKKYMRDQFDYFGIKTPLRRAIIKAYINNNSLPTDKEMETVVWELWNHANRECVYAAIEILAKDKKNWKKGHIKLFEKLALKKSWWDSVDAIQSFLIGPYFKLFPEKIKPVTGKWNRSKNSWLQRLSITFQLMYKKETDEKLLYNYINNLKNSKEFFVQKAIGWALRQYARTKPGSVKKFVLSTNLKPLSVKEALRHI